MPPDVDRWRKARLIPAAGIKSAQEQETRATSALLAVMMAVPEFARAVLKHLDAPAGRVTTFTEVSLPGAGSNGQGNKVRPDGAIVVERGKTWWACFVEVKTGPNVLTEEQVSAYLDLARENGLQGLLTISNEIAATPGESPLAIDGRKLRNLTLCHLSWWRVLTEAVVQHEHRGVSDPDQAWILAELIAYLQDPRSGAGSFDDLGPHWVAVRDGARQGTLRGGHESASVVAGWEDFIRYVSLGLCQELGRDVEPVYPRRLDPQARRAEADRRLIDSGCLAAAIRVPDAVGPIEVEADLRARQLVTAIVVPAPKEGRAATRVRWILRQLRDAPPGIRIEASFANVRDTTSCMVNEALVDDAALMLPGDSKREPRAFRLALAKEIGRKRGSGDDSFVKETSKQILAFYGELVQHLRPWTPSAPRLKPQAQTEADRVPSLEDRAGVPPAVEQGPWPAAAEEALEGMSDTEDSTAGPGQGSWEGDARD